MKWNLPLLAIGALLIAGLVFVLSSGFGHDPHEVPFMLSGRPAPDFALAQIGEDKTLTLKDVLDKPLVLNFWSTWCVPCQAEHPVLEWGHKKFGDKVNFVGVVYQDTRENVDAFLQQTPVPWLQLFDGRGRASVDYGLAGVPETYFISRDQVIRYKHVGPINAERLATKVEELLQAERK